MGEHDVFCNFGRGHYEEHFCKIILNLIKEMTFNDISIISSGNHFVQQNGTVCAIAIMVEGIIRNISVKLF